jgi:hypothetical protein
MAYNVETILAEKFETIITCGVINTRMRDFYDIHILTTTQAFAADVFRAALRNTAEKRGTVGQIRNMRDTIAMLSENGVMADRWVKYSKKYSYAAGITWQAAIDSVKALILKATGERL